MKVEVEKSLIQTCIIEIESLIEKANSEDIDVFEFYEQIVELNEWMKNQTKQK